MKVNYKSDFDYFLDLKDTNGTDIGFPTFDFRVRMTTSGSSQYYEASCIDGECVNCFNDDGRLHVVCDSHGLRCGMLKIEFHADPANAIYPDQKKLTVTPMDTDIELVRDVGDDNISATMEMSMPWVLETAYELARRQGYAGTSDEYYHSLFNLPYAFRDTMSATTQANIAAQEARVATAECTSAELLRKSAENDRQTLYGEMLELREACDAVTQESADKSSDAMRAAEECRSAASGAQTMAGEAQLATDACREQTRLCYEQTEISKVDISNARGAAEYAVRSGQDAESAAQEARAATAAANEAAQEASRSATTAMVMGNRADQAARNANGAASALRTRNLADTDKNNNFSTAQTINGTLTVNGDIVQTGEIYVSHAQDVYTRQDVVHLRDGAVGGLAVGEYAGIVAEKYNGEDDGVLVFDADGVARVGDEGDAQPLLTRVEAEDIEDGALLRWDAQRMCAVPLDYELVDLRVEFEDDTVSEWDLVAIRKETQE